MSDTLCGAYLKMADPTGTLVLSPISLVDIQKQAHTALANIPGNLAA